MRRALVTLAVLVLAVGNASILRADDVDKDERGERIRQGILNYLNDVRGKKDELQGAEKEVREILATDARIKDLKAAKIKIDGDKVTIDIWYIDAKTGTVGIFLVNRNQTAFINFKGTATPKAGGPPQVVITGVTRAHTK